MHQRFGSIAYTMMSRRLLILFILVVYTFIPSVHSIACDEHVSPSHGRVIDISYKNLPQTNVTFSITDTDRHDDKPSTKNEAADCCSTCCNTIGGISSHNYNTIFISVSLVPKPVFIAFLEPVFSINKPPQN